MDSVRRTPDHRNPVDEMAYEVTPVIEQEGTIVRKRRFAQVPDELITDQRLPDRAVRLWCRLDHYAGADGAAFPKVKTLAGDLHCSPASIDRALAELVRAGWITRARRYPGGPCDTTLMDDPHPTVLGDPRVTRDATKKETQRRRPKEPSVAPADADADGTPGQELDLGIPPAATTGAAPAQVLVSAYADALKAAGGVPTRAVLAACGRNVKRLIEQDHIDPPVLLRAVQRAGAARSRDIDRHLGDAQQAYGRQATRKAMFTAWDNIAADLTAQRTTTGA